MRIKHRCNTQDRPQEQSKDREKITGCTVHLVNEKLDDGKIIIKKRVLVSGMDSPEKLRKKVQSEEYKAYSMAIRRMYAFD